MNYAEQLRKMTQDAVDAEKINIWATLRPPMEKAANSKQYSIVVERHLTVDEIDELTLHGLNVKRESDQKENRSWTTISWEKAIRSAKCGGIGKVIEFMPSDAEIPH